MKRLGEELQEKHKTALSALKSELDKEMDKERTSLTKALHEEREKLKSLQAALENDESKKCSLMLSVCTLSVFFCLI